ncbi:MAG: T9SS type A sorting domain-containing protein [Candidatus Eisenbacteria bacterium]|uniref:T9SS type A sorting domain-containing protein n=1 Tax=Eiseniibacteriota bacterium TaxID=2212470 RepID=A0A7Y2EC40_UNCEI|nr:T9SS type A sorting domain-containing protein [Candidatus Eisenbacteria bacterium]
MRRATAWLAFLLAVSVLLPGFASVGSAQVTANWTSLGANDLWSNSDNWDLGGSIPINTGTTYYVVIPSSELVDFDVAGSSAVDSLNLGSSSTLNILTGNSLDILNDITARGAIVVSGGTLTANGTGNDIDEGLFQVDSGGLFQTSATSYSFGTSPSSGIIHSSSGVGSVLDLSSLATYTDNRNLVGSPTRTISATNSGSIDLSSLTTVVGGAGADVLRFSASSGGNIDLTALTTTSGNVNIELDTGAYSLPALTSATTTRFELIGTTPLTMNNLATQDQGEFDQESGTSISATSLTNVTATDIFLDGTASLTTGSISDFDGSRITVTGGATFGSSVTTSSYNYDVTGAAASGVTMFADGVGSAINLSSLTSFSDNANLLGSPTRTITASNSGSINLGNVTTLVGGLGTSDKLALKVESGGDIDLNNLVTQSGNTIFTSNIFGYSLPALTTSEQLRVEVGAASSFALPVLSDHDQGAFDVATTGAATAPSLTSLTASDVDLDGTGTLTTGTLSNVDGSRFRVSGGATFGSSISATTYNYDVTGADASGNTMQATGAGSALDLSSLTSFSDNANLLGSPIRFIDASDNGFIDMSNVTTLVGAAGADRLSIELFTGGDIDLSSLTTLTNNVQFQINIPSYTLPSLTTSTGTEYYLDGGNTLSMPLITSIDQGFLDLEIGSTLTAPNLTSLTATGCFIEGTASFTTGSLSNIDGSLFQLAGGSTFGSSITATTYDYDVPGVVSNAQIFAAEGVGTLLDLSSLVTFNDSANLLGSPTRTMTAGDSGVIDLSNLTSFTGAGGSDHLVISIDTNGDVDFSSLATMIGNTVLDITLTSYTLPSLLTTSGVDFWLGGSTTINIPVATSIDDADFSLPSGSTISAPSVTSLTASSLSLASGITFTTAILSNIDGTSVSVVDGETFGGQVSATAYNYNVAGAATSGDNFSASGTGSSIDLSTIEFYSDNLNAIGTPTRGLTASLDGIIDLSGVRKMVTPSQDNFDFDIASGGQILLPSVWELDGDFQIDISGATSRMEFGNLHLEQGDRTISMADGSSLHIKRAFTFENTTESQVDLDGGRLYFDDASAFGSHQLEAGSQDLGTGGPTSGNFGVGQVVADNGITLQISDTYDNGNRGGGQEALYLFGIGVDDGLRVLAGSEVIIPEDVNVYANVSSVMTHLNALFPVNVTSIAFDGGTLTLGRSSVSTPFGNGSKLALQPAAPNPMHGATSIRFSLPSDQPVDLGIYDLRGRLVNTLSSNQVLAAGEHAMSWSGRNERGHRVASGIYFIRLRSQDAQLVQRVMVLD